MTEELRRVTVTELRNSPGRVIDQVVATNTPVTITRYGKPVAVLAPYRWYERLREASRTHESEAGDG